MPLFRRGRSPLSGAQVDPHDWTLPSSYTTSPSKSGGYQIPIPDPTVFSNAEIPRLSNSGLPDSTLTIPDPSHAAVHLALLECFHGLRLSATALDVPAELPPQYEEKNDNTSGSRAPATQSERWDVLLRLAVTRFGVWWSQIHLVLTHAAAYANRGGSKTQIQLTEPYLPPLDVLLVWYAFILDSDSYTSACRARQSEVPALPFLCFPWKAVCAVIDMETMMFELPRGAQTLFHTLSGQSADILTYLRDPPAYTEETSPLLPVDLVAEVKKHESLFDEAHSLLWIRSPALRGSLERASAEFECVKAQLAGNPAAEPSFGVRLFWMTFQLFPSVYEAFVHRSNAPGYHENESSDGNDKCKESHLAPSEPSSHCVCWTCERIRDDLPHFTRPKGSIIEKTSSSSSSSAGMFQQLSSLSAEQLRQIQDDLGFHRAVEKARSCGQTLPSRPLTDAQKQKLKLAKQRQEAVGYLPGVDEFAELQADGSTKIKRAKYANAWKGLGWV